MLLLFFILIRDLTFASTISIAKLITPSYGKYLILFYISQIIAAPFQAAYSDHSCRKKSLTFAFMIISLCHLLLFFGFEYKLSFFLLLCVILSGLLGNVFPIALAGLMDIDYLKSTKKMMTAAMTALGIAWLGYEYGTKFMGLIGFFWLTTALSFICLILSHFCFQDIRDKDQLSKKRLDLKTEFREILKIFKEKFLLLMLKVYLLSEIVYYGLFYYHLEENTNAALLIVTTYAVGFIMGNIIVNFSRFSLRTGVILGFSLSLFSILFLLVTSFFFQYKFTIFTYIILETLFSLGYGIFDPCFYSFIGRKMSTHKRGRAFGLVDSSDNLSELFVNVVLVSTMLSTRSLLIFRSVSLILLAASLILILKAFKLDKKISNSN